MGRSPTSGHYRAFLNSWGEVGRADNPHEPYIFPVDTLVTEDGQPAQKATDEDVEVIYRNVYMVWCLKSAGLPSTETHIMEGPDNSHNSDNLNM